ncbi:hypothetical protein LLG90_16520 [Aromatoleum toluclasticum]|nr:hypothetical protein [Aromatoleum toluclasticum]
MLVALAPFALSVSLGRRLLPLADGVLQNATAMLVCLLAVSLPGALHARLERLAFLRAKAVPPAPPPRCAPPQQECEWRELPNGLRYRTTAGGEICMGGPITSYHLFSNGIVLGTDHLTLSTDGRYAACNDLRHGRPIMLADLENGIVRDCEADDEVDAIRAAGAQLAEVRHLLRRPGSVQYVRVHGLWVAPDCEIPPDQFVLPDPQGRPRLHLERKLDEAALLTADAPLSLLLTGDYTLSLDGEALPVRTSSPTGIVWSEDGDMLLIPALPRQPGAAGSHWLWRRNGLSGWVNPLRWNVEDSLPSGGMRGVCTIDAEGYWVELYMNHPSGTGYPQRALQSRFPSCFYGGAPREWITGADERGRLVIQELTDTDASLRVRLPWSGLREEATLESCPAPATSPTTAVARFTPQPWPGGGLRPYRVEAGAATAEDVALFHLWSDCGRYLALQPHCRRGEAPNRFFVLDTSSGRRLETRFRACGLHLLGWACGELQVGIVVGKVSDIHFSFDPFAAVDPPPRPAEDGNLHGKWLITEGLRFRVADGGEQLIGPLSKQVVLTLPPYPNAAFDFHYRAPTGDRSVFVFGARNKYQDDYDRAQCCRYQARAITSDGICLEGLGVGMIWSENGRYLMVTNRVPRDHPDYRDTAWKARLVDCDERLIYPEISLGCMPIFETWSGDSIDYRQVDDDWWREDVESRPARLPLADLLEGEPEALRCQEGFWLPAGSPWLPHWREAFALAFGDTSRR